jgi:hypothetical protein
MALRAHKAHIFPEACSSIPGGQWDYGLQINGTYKRQATASKCVTRPLLLCEIACREVSSGPCSCMTFTSTGMRAVAWTPPPYGEIV